MQWLNEWDQGTRRAGNVPDAAILRDMGDFYAQLGRDAESRQWRDVYGQLASGVTPAR
jgi:hypothetical protein